MNSQTANEARDLSAILPDGRSFDFWEREPVVLNVLHVNPSHPNASDENDGSADAPFCTIGKAAELAVPGTRISPPFCFG